MAETVLVTGGAGFLGSHVCDKLLELGYNVRVLDNLTPQVHGPGELRPEYLSREVELVIADVRDQTALKGALKDVSAVIHLAARIGVGQSMYRIASYVDVNDGGTAHLLQAISEKPVGKLVVASSMSVYGEGRYRTVSGTIVDDAVRDMNRLQGAEWEPVDSAATPLVPLPTPEDKRPSLTSIYALTKYSQEQQCLLIGRAYGISTIALRFFNIYGPRQALSNPYTGVLAIFASRLLNGNAPFIFEDGGQLRDFVHVRDAAQACVVALEASPRHDGAYNIGSGETLSILEVSDRLQRVMGGRYIPPVLSGRHRVGDVRHCFADISAARNRLDYVPEIGFDEGIAELAEWLEAQAAVDLVDQATVELTHKGLMA